MNSLLSQYTSGRTSDSSIVAPLALVLSTACPADFSRTVQKIAASSFLTARAFQIWCSTTRSHSTIELLAKDPVRALRWPRFQKSCKTIPSKHRFEIKVEHFLENHEPAQPRTQQQVRKFLHAGCPSTWSRAVEL